MRALLFLFESYLGKLLLVSMSLFEDRGMDAPAHHSNLTVSSESVKSDI